MKQSVNFSQLGRGEFYMTVEDFKDSFKYFTIIY